MPSRGQSVTITYVAWDTTANAGKTGDVANHTLRWVKDGVSSAPTNAASEVDSVNAPGVYKLTLTGTEATCDVGTLSGKSATANISIIPLTIAFEQLPTTAAGNSGGLPVIGSAPLTNLDAAVSTRSTYSGGVVLGVTNPVTVGTVSSGAISSASFTTGTVNASATGILERLLLLVGRFYPLTGGKVTQPTTVGSSGSQCIQYGASGTAIATQSVTNDGTTQTIFPAT